MTGLKVTFNSNIFCLVLVFAKAFAVYFLLLISSLVFEFNEVNLLANFHYPTQDIPAPWRSLFTWDARFYWYIADQGYRTPPSQAFYPLFPLILRLFKWTNLPLVGLFINTSLLAISIILLRQLVQKDFGEKTANWTILSLLCYPSSFYFHLLYSESLFLCLLVLGYYFFQQAKHLFAGLCFLLLAMTRPIGILIIAPLVILLQKNKDLSISQKLLLILAPLFGFFIAQYLISNGQSFLSASFKAQTFFQSGNQITNLWLGWNWLERNFLDLNWTWHGVTNSLWDRLLLILLIIFLPLIYKKQNATYFLWAILAGLIPALSGTIMAYNRYLLLVFPLFIQIAICLQQVPRKHLWSLRLLIVIASLIQIIFIIRYGLNLWVA